MHRNPPQGALSHEAARSRWLAAGLLALTAVLLLLGASVGSTGWESMWSLRDDPVVQQIVWDIRLPRALGAWLAGGGFWCHCGQSGCHQR